MAPIEFRVISLTTASQRRAMVKLRMGRLGLPWRFFDAHTAADNTLPYDAERALTRRGYRLKPAEIGCFSSHVGCLRAYLEDADGSEFLLVLEDDVLLDEHFDFSALPELMRSLEAFIEENGQWERAAKRLFCHRHTLRYRIRRVEELTGRDLASARDRIEFWLALRGRELIS